ncbi:MAG: LysR family transcriptional regulator [Thermoanaerobaculia bacterium]|nr:LysR family transcriptional regulator [Thermoanaerobaculia bacterium]
MKTGARPRPMELEVRDLRLVRAIVEDGGLVRAAERLHLTPSALSHRLADLERRAGVPLFRRGGRRLVPTPAGETLFDSAPRLLTAMAEAEAAVRRTAEARAAVVRVATECYTCYHWLPAVLSRFEREHPRVEVRIVLPATRRAVLALLDGELDLAISDSPQRDGRLALHPLFRSDFVAVVAPSHPWAKRPFVRAADFARERLLRYPMPREHSTLLTEILAPAGVVPAAEESVELTEALLELVRAGRGVAALASWVVTPWVARGELVAVPIRAPAARRQWVAVTRRLAHPDPHLLAFVRALRAADLPSAGIFKPLPVPRA